MKINKQIKIILVLIVTFFITELLSSFFVNFTPKINQAFVSFNIILKAEKFIVANFFTKKITPTPTQTPPLILITPSATISPTKIQNTPTLSLSPIPTIQQKITKSPTPTTIPSPTETLTFAGCPATSNQSYNSIGAERGSGDMPLNGDPVNSPEINLRLRGFGPVNEGANFISRNGNNYGLDDQMPPQISSLFGGAVPQIIKTYVVYEWDFQNNKSLAPQQATPNFKVHLVGLQANPGQKLVGLTAGRKIDPAGDVFMVLYATKTDITFTHSPSDSLLGGYLFYFADLCVDPNLLAKYQADNAGGRGQLPVVGKGQVFGYAGNSDVKVGIRDTMSFVDPRYKQDWWSWNGTAN